MNIISHDVTQRSAGRSNFKVTKLDHIFAKNLKSLMKSRGMTCVQFTSESGISRTHLCSIRNAKMCLTTYTIDRICKALGVEPSAMLEE